MSANWQEAATRNPCPACGKTDWCARKVDGDAVRCMRVSEAPPGWRLVIKCQDGGTVFAPENCQAPGSTGHSPRQQPGKPARNWGAEATQYAKALPPEKLRELAGQLGVRTDALQAIGVGWREADNTLVFPERDANGQVVGINRRYHDGAKKMIHGGHRGVIVPEGFATMPDPVLAVEGASDVAAALSMGLTAVGRSNNRTVKHLPELLAGREVLVLGENDQKPDGSWPGHEGAVVVAKSLARTWAMPVRWALPPEASKDARSWLNDRGVDLNDRDARTAAGRELLALLERSANTIEPRKKPSGDNGEAPRKSQADLLIGLTQEVQLFHTPGNYDSEGFASFVVNGHRETWQIGSKAFRRWLGRLFYLEYGKAPSSQPLQDALNVIIARAIHDGPEYTVSIRLAEHNGTIWLDLCDPEWRAIEVTSSGWQVVNSGAVPVRFVRKRGMQPLPVPVAEGAIDDLRRFVNLPDDTAWHLAIAWLVAALRPNGPYPILVLNGEQGSAKSTVARVLRTLVDPNAAPLRAEPRECRDLAIAASNSWCLVFDNLSKIPAWLSDALCRLATGGGFATRELYSDDNEKLFDSMRPIAVNGIEEIAVRGDLLDRAISLTLPEIPEHQRRTEADLWREFDAARPGILGALLDAVVVGLRNIKSVQLDRLPRMADFAMWITAAEPALPWACGAFMQAYAGNREEAVTIALESSPIGPAILGLLHTEERWEGTSNELLAELSTDRHSDEKTRRRRDWPRTPRAMGGALRRLAPHLRAAGYEVSSYREATVRRRRIIQLEQVGTQPSKPSKPSTTLLGGVKTAIPPGRSLDGLDGRQGNQSANRPEENGVSESSGPMPDGVDGLDGQTPTHSSEDPEPRKLPTAGEGNADTAERRAIQEIEQEELAL